MGGEGNGWNDEGKSAVLLPPTDFIKPALEIPKIKWKDK
jgi:hypothetical protein